MPLRDTLLALLICPACLAGAPLLILAALFSGCGLTDLTRDTDGYCRRQDMRRIASSLAFRSAVKRQKLQVEGSFRVTGGGDRDINAFVVDAVEYVNYRGSNPNFYSIYSRHRVSVGRFDLPLDKNSGPYYFILSNRFSWITDKW